MRICGLNKTTLLDYPGMVAATVFLGGCNFRCPFCQNGSLVLHPGTQPVIEEEMLLAFLDKRKKLLDGVCITGGEPTLYPDLPVFIKKIKDLGYHVKLDTNGSNPALVKHLVHEGFLDKVAMDIKTSKQNYSRLTGISAPDMSAISEMVDFLLNGDVDYEFRTTVVKELHTEQDIIEIGEWIAGAKAYYLQAYKDSPDVLKPGFNSYSFEDLQRFQALLLKTIPLVEIRGID